VKGKQASLGVLSCDPVAYVRFVLLYMRYGLGIVFIEHLYTPHGTRNNYSAVANLHSLQIFY
jgi:hypothetical protein